MAKLPKQIRSKGYDKDAATVIDNLPPEYSEDMVRYGRVIGRRLRNNYIIKSETLQQEIILNKSFNMNFSEGQRIWYVPDESGGFLAFGAAGLEMRIQKALSDIDTSNVFAVNIFDPMDPLPYGYEFVTVTQTKEELKEVRKKAATWGSGICYLPNSDYCSRNKCGGTTTISKSEFIPEKIPESEKEGMLFIPVNWLISVEKRMWHSRPTSQSEKVPHYLHLIRPEDLKLCVKYTKLG